MNEYLSHDDLRAALPEQALEILDGRTRAEVLAHVEMCASCAEELEQFTETADALVHLAPGIEPPVGFESQVVERIRATAQGTPARRRRAPVLLGIAASFLLAFGIGWVAHAATSSNRAPATAIRGHVAERTLVDANGAVGAAYVYTGSPSWMFVTVSVPGAPTAVRCTVVDTNGQRQVLGTFALASGKGAWGTPLPVPFSSVRGIELSTRTGGVVASLGQSNWSYTTSAGSHHYPISWGA
jgi:hypothetical protein